MRLAVESLLLRSLLDPAPETHYDSHRGSYRHRSRSHSPLQGPKPDRDTHRSDNYSSIGGRQPAASATWSAQTLESRGKEACAHSQQLT